MGAKVTGCDAATYNSPLDVGGIETSKEERYKTRGSSDGRRG